MMISPVSEISVVNKLCCYIFLILFISCTTKSGTNDLPSPVEIDDDGIEVLMDEDSSDEVMASLSAMMKNEKKDFKVVLSADTMMYLGQSSMMKVWIGEEDIDLSFSKGMKQDVKRISSTIGRFAKIAPFAPDFEITALSTTLCYKIDPSGSEVSYSLKPKDEGEYKVGAAIELFETEDCTGVSVPKTAKLLSVKVGVNMNKEISKKIHEMERDVWYQFKIFWIALITLLFGAAIFVARKFIKRNTGYDQHISNLNEPSNPDNT